MKHSRTGWLLWTALALATLVLIYTEPTVHTFSLALLSWVGGLISFFLFSSDRPRTGVQNRG